MEPWHKTKKMDQIKILVPFKNNSLSMIKIHLHVKKTISVILHQVGSLCMWYIIMDFLTKLPFYSTSSSSKLNDNADAFVV